MSRAKETMEFKFMNGVYKVVRVTNTIELKPGETIGEDFMEGLLLRAKAKGNLTIKVT